MLQQKVHFKSCFHGDFNPQTLVNLPFFECQKIKVAFAKFVAGDQKSEYGKK